MPELLILLFAVASGGAVAVVCAICAAQPEKVAGYIRQKYNQSKWAKVWPFSGMVLKGSYPIYLRVCGAGGLVCTLVWLVLVFRLFSK